MAPWHPSANLVLILATGLGVLLRAYQLTRPGFLFGITEYDDGAYFGSAVRLVHGAVPYRDFVMVQPPGILWLTSPLALLTKVTSTAAGFALARVLTAAAGAAGVLLAGLLVRRHGALATALTCGILATSPAGINAAHTLLLEPWAVVFCLLGALAVFDGDQPTERPGRLAWGGAAFGFAVAIKLWAVLPVLVVAVVCRRRRAWLPFGGGVVGGLGMAVLPAVALAPGAVFHDVVVAQLSRVDLVRVPAWHRLAGLTGMSAFSPVSRGTVWVVAAGILALVVGCSVAASRRDRQAPPPLEQFALATAGLLLVAFLWPPDYYAHYGWFFAPFLALSVALPVARLAAGRRALPVAGGRPGVWLARSALAAALVLALVISVVQLRQETRLRGDTIADVVRARVPAGACVLADIASVTVAADRFVSDVPGCPVLVDSIGTDYALSRGRNGVTGAGRDPALQRVWLNAFKHAQYVWLACGSPDRRRCKTTRRIPWTTGIRTYFRHHFAPVAARRVGLYARDRPPG